MVKIVGLIFVVGIVTLWNDNPTQTRVARKLRTRPHRHDTTNVTWAMHGLLPCVAKVVQIFSTG